MRRLAAVLAALSGAAWLAPAAAAAPPSNDQREAATALSPPGGLEGTTAESTLEPEESANVQGAEVTGSVWYTFTTGSARRVVLRLVAHGDLDSGIEVYRRARSQLPLEQSALTDEDGRAGIIFDSRARGTYFVRVVQRANSVPGTFRLDVDLPQLHPPAPGPLLPPGGVSGRVDGLRNAADGYSAVLRVGRTYRVNLANLSPNRLFLGIYGPGTTSFRDDAPIRRGRGYALVTPGPGEGGRYSFLVSASRVIGRQDYHLQVGPAGRDDQWPGEVLPNRRRVRGSLNARALDAVDVYRFDVVDRSTVALRLSTGDDDEVTLRLKRAGGRRVATTTGEGGAELRETLTAGRYVLQLRARGATQGAYTLRRIARIFTRLRIDAGSTYPPGATVPLRLDLNPGGSGPARITIERFDPFEGWLFDRRVRTTIRDGRGTVAFRPPTIGRWRARAEFLGSRTAEQSATRRDAEFSVSTPLQP